MFTIKWMKPNGAEELHDVHSVRSEPNGKGGATVYAEVPIKGGSQTLTFEGQGDVYVTNANGRTVSHYFLG